MRPNRRSDGEYTADLTESSKIFLSEEEISDVSLATFYVFDNETGPLAQRLRLARGGCGGGGCGGHGCGGGGGCHAGGGCHMGGCGGGCIWVVVIWAVVTAEGATDTSSLEPASAVLGVVAVVAVAVPAGYGHREAGSTAAALSLYRHLVSPSK